MGSAEMSTGEIKMSTKTKKWKCKLSRDVQWEKTLKIHILWDQSESERKKAIDTFQFLCKGKMDSSDLSKANIIVLALSINWSLFLNYLYNMNRISVIQIT